MFDSEQVVSRSDCRLGLQNCMCKCSIRYMSPQLPSSNLVGLSKQVWCRNTRQEYTSARSDSRSAASPTSIVSNPGYAAKFQHRDYIYTANTGLLRIITPVMAPGRRHHCAANPGCSGNAVSGQNCPKCRGYYPCANRCGRYLLYVGTNTCPYCIASSASSLSHFDIDGLMAIWSS